MTVRKLIVIVALLAAIIGAWTLPASAGTQPCNGRVDVFCEWTGNDMFCLVYLDVAPNQVICVEVPPIY